MNHVFLALNRRWTVLINREGEVEGRIEARRNAPTLPYVTFKGKDHKFAFQPEGKGSVTITRDKFD